MVSNGEYASVEECLQTMQAQVASRDESEVSPQMENGLKQGSVENSVYWWTLESLKSSVSGEMVGPIDSDHKVRFSSVSTDSRTIQSGGLYIAIKGENFDGHDFIAQAIQQGAAAVMLSEPRAIAVPGVLVEDTRIALGLFAKWHRLQMPVKKLIAVTGSNGKTTTKTLLESIFSRVGKTLATQGNFNNDFGVPRTLLNLRPEHDYAIIEMGANHRGEIQYLTHLAQPDIALITNASGAHLEGFGSLQGVIETKGEIFQGLNQREGHTDGLAVINTDSQGYEQWQAIITQLGVRTVLRFGTHKEADIRVESVTTNERGVAFDVQIHGQKYSVEMPVLGLHNAMNAAACIAISLGAGLDWQSILSGLEGFTGVAGRLQKNAIKTGWLIDDSYNANPESVKAGIDALVSLPGESILCLGAMAELGEVALDEHRNIAAYAKQRGVKYLLVYGDNTQPMPDVFGEGGYWFSEHEALANKLQVLLAQFEKIDTKANVLVKGSRSAGMERVTQQFMNMAHDKHSNEMKD